jgi:hypothetical protein
MKPHQPFWGLLRRQERLLPTFRGWALLLLVAAGLVFAAMRCAHPFLAIQDEVLSGALVVDGWQPDYALEEAAAEFRRHSYTKLFVTGGPIDQGASLSEYKSYAELGAAVLKHMGLDPNAIQPVPAPSVCKDRTHALGCLRINHVP